MRIFVVGLSLVVLLAGLDRAGVWEPGELAWAEQARAVATHAFGARDLEPDGRRLGMPTRNDLGHGELATDSSALGFRLFGLSERAGRLPIALFGLLGVIACMGLGRLRADERTAGYAGLVLVTMPAYFTPARSMCSDVPTMAAIVLAVVGLEMRGAGFVLAAAGLLLGFLARGAIFGVALPLLVVSVSAIVLRRFDGRAQATAVVGVLALAAGVFALSQAAPGLAPLALGATKTALATPHPTFDTTLAEIGHGAFPWSALAPVALFSRDERHLELRVLAIVGTASSYALHSFTADLVTPVPFLGLPFLALGIAIAFRDWELGGRTPLLAGVCVASLLVLLVLDFTRFPDKSLVAYGRDPIHQVKGLGPLFVAAGVVAGLSALVAAMSGRFGARVWFFGALAAALFVRFAIHPRLGELLSSRAAFAAFREHGSDGRLALWGVSQKAAIYSGISAEIAPTPGSALDFLAEKNAFVALPLERLPELNALHRSRTGTNLPVVDARSPSAILAVGALPSGEHDQSPLAELVFDRLPSGITPLDVELGKRVRMSGIAIQSRGKRRFDVAMYYRVTAAGLGGHCTFLHVDRSPTRHSVEHLDWSSYPLSVWQPGDVVKDTFDVQLPASFGSGRYALWFGFGVMPCSDDRRLNVTSGPSEDNRVLGGFIEVR